MFMDMHGWCTMTDHRIQFDSIVSKRFIPKTKIVFVWHAALFSDLNKLPPSNRRLPIKSTFDIGRAHVKHFTHFHYFTSHIKSNSVWIFRSLTYCSHIAKCVARDRTNKHISFMAAPLIHNYENREHCAGIARIEAGNGGSGGKLIASASNEQWEWP